MTKCIQCNLLCFDNNVNYNLTATFYTQIICRTQLIDCVMGDNIHTDMTWWWTSIQIIIAFVEKIICIRKQFSFHDAVTVFERENGISTKQCSLLHNQIYYLFFFCLLFHFFLIDKKTFIKNLHKIIAKKNILI